MLKSSGKKNSKPLALQLYIQKAMDLIAYFNAYHNIKKLGKDKYMASGVIIEIKNLSGVSVIEPVMIQDGLSVDTINALTKDIKASYDYRLLMNKL